MCSQTSSSSIVPPPSSASHDRSQHDRSQPSGHRSQLTSPLSRDELHDSYSRSLSSIDALFTVTVKRLIFVFPLVHNFCRTSKNGKSTAANIDTVW